MSFAGSGWLVVRSGVSLQGLRRGLGRGMFGIVRGKGGIGLKGKYIGHLVMSLTRERIGRAGDQF